MIDTGRHRRHARRQRPGARRRCGPRWRACSPRRAFRRTIPLAERFGPASRTRSPSFGLPWTVTAAGLPGRVLVPAGAAPERREAAAAVDPRARPVHAPGGAQPRHPAHPVPQHGADRAGGDGGRRGPSHGGFPARASRERLYRSSIERCLWAGRAAAGRAPPRGPAPGADRCRHHRRGIHRAGRRPRACSAGRVDVTVLEGHRIGWGASGRNGGFVLPGLQAGDRSPRDGNTASTRPGGCSSCRSRRWRVSRSSLPKRESPVTTGVVARSRSLHDPPPALAGGQ